MKNIVVATDGSEQARKALESAAGIAASMDAELTVCHVLMHHRPPEELGRMAQVEHMVPEVTRRALPGIDNIPGSMMSVFDGLDTRADAERVIGAIGDQIVHLAERDAKEMGAKSVKSQVRDGDYAKAIIDTANDVNADMIVMGKRGLGPLTELFLGSVSRKVLSMAKCSVLVVK